MVFGVPVAEAPERVLDQSVAVAGPPVPGWGHRMVDWLIMTVVTVSRVPVALLGHTAVD